MFGRQKITELQLRKRALLLESDLNRLALRTEWEQVCAATAWTSQFTRLCRQANPWLTLLAPLAGLLTARATRREGGLFSRLLGVLKWIPPLLALCRNFPKPDGESTASGDPQPTAATPASTKI